MKIMKRFRYPISLGSSAILLALAASSYDTGLLTVSAGQAAERTPDSSSQEVGAAARTTSGLQVVYDFHSSEGRNVEDRSRVGPPVTLQVSDENAVTRREGTLDVTAPVLIASDEPAQKLNTSIPSTGEVTVEVWIRPAKIDQSGPARIVTISQDPNGRNITLGQDGDKYDVRLRTTDTNANGIPSLSSPPGSLTTDLTHVVYTHDRSGRTRIYINGEQVAEAEIGGSLSNWDGSYRLALANEFSGDRPWLGTYRLVAIYNRDLLPHEVERHFQLGPEAAHASKLADARTQLFNNEIAPLLTRKCLECHDSYAKAGGLDLSRKKAALAGGESGKAIAPGSAADSLLWEMVASGEMPQDRPPLSDEEKASLRAWIDGGAQWSTDFIDPAVYLYDRPRGQVWLQRLTVPEYIETVRSAVGVDIDEEARKILPPDLRADGFSNTAYNLNVDLGHVEAYAELAEIIVGRMDVLEFAARFSESRSLSTDDTMRDFVAAMGKWLLRGPLNEREVTNYSGIATTVASAGGDFEEAASGIIEAMLQSPRFLYRFEDQRGDGTAWPVGDYELASRLSYILWGAPPDEELMRAADEGRLTDPNELAQQVERMLQDARAVSRSLQFATEWLDLDRLSSLSPDRNRFPDWDDDLASDMRSETLAFFEEVVWTQKRPMADLLNAQVTFATPRLATHYGLEPQGDGLTRYDLASIPSRGGLLTQGSTLTIGGDEASMVARGLFVLHDLMRGVVRDPPACVDTTPVPTEPGLSQRAIAEQRLANVACGGCHSKFEPYAFGLERFNGLGAYREIDEHGNKLLENGVVLIPGAEQTSRYESISELMDLLARSDRVSRSITWKVTQFALGRPLTAADAGEVDRIHETASADGGTYPALLKAIVMSDLVRMKQTEAMP